MTPAMLPPLSLVLGGAASGKSRHAERMLEASGLRPVYVATAQAFDTEMQARIAEHRARRDTAWRTCETPDDPVSAIRATAPGEAVLLDCLTLWLSNRLLAEADLMAETAALCAGLAAAPVPVVAVSNEVGHGLVPETALGRRFRDAQGRLNQMVAASAQQVVMVHAGLPVTLKAPA